MITITGLGPGSLERVAEPVRDILLDEGRTLIVRTVQHPASLELSQLRHVVFCDDLYEAEDDYESIYSGIADRVLTAAAHGQSVVYAVPGSPLVGEFAVKAILERAEEAQLLPAESFVDAVLAEMAYDPLDRGLQILNGHELPDPLILDKPTIIAHLDRPEVLAEVLDAVGRVIAEEETVTLLAGLGADGATVVSDVPGSVDPGPAGVRTSLFVDSDPAGLVGGIRIMRRLRSECPWDQEQSHHSLVKNLVEETHELIDAISSLPREEVDWVAYAAVEDELGDVLLQVLFHEAIAREVGAFDIDGVAEVMRQKLIRRHPHVFGDVEVDSAAEVKANWDRIKAAESGDAEPSALDGVPQGMSALHRASKLQNRAAKVGFDWEQADQVMPKVLEELEELQSALRGDGDIEAEMGDLIFSLVNLARHLGVDPELALARANRSFESRFRQMESAGPLEGLSLDQLNERWEGAKRLLPE